MTTQLIRQLSQLTSHFAHCADDCLVAQTQCAEIGPLIHQTFASQNLDSVACRASPAYDLPLISERFLLDLWQLEISGQSVLHTNLVLELRDSLPRLPGVLELHLSPLMPISIV